MGAFSINFGQSSLGTLGITPRINASDLPTPAKSSNRTDTILEIIDHGVNNGLAIYNAVKISDLLKQQIQAKQVPSIYTNPQGLPQGGATYAVTPEGSIFSGNFGTSGAVAGNIWIWLAVIAVVVLLLLRR